MDIPGEKLIIKLWETLVDKGVGGLLKPWQIRRVGQAEIDRKYSETLMLAQAEKQADAIRRGELTSVPNYRWLGHLSGSESDTSPASGSEIKVLEDPATVASRNKLGDAVREEVAIAKAVLYAEDALKGDHSPPPNTTVDDDWLLRWREYAARVSADNLQQLWGKVLAGEVKSPGLYSMRTLEVLKNLSQEEARKIERLFPLIVEGVLYRGDEALLQILGFSLFKQMEMEDIGILSGVAAHGMGQVIGTISATRFEAALKSHGVAIVVAAEDPARTIVLPACLLTTVGKQIMSLGVFQVNERMLHAVANDIKRQGFTVARGTYVETGGGAVSVSNLGPI
jgi:Protein of unknown function (DUF2806)